ncbi:MAG: DUF6261 family protein [Bacteroidales bacterium]|jgi:hypothetical protein|nr:DUF6261 family protein [Bacteroidales bacterium]
MLKKNFTRLTNEALANLASQTMNAVTLKADPAISTNPVYTPIHAAYNQFFALLNKETYSGMGEQMSTEDKRRDEAYTHLKMVVDGLAFFTGFEIGRNAATLKPLFDREGNMSEKTYAQQTAAMDRLMADLLLEANQTLLTEIGIWDLYDNVRRLNASFKGHYLTQVDANSALRQMGTATEKRKNLEEKLKDFYNLVDAMKTQPSWDDLYSDLEELQMRTKF